MVHPSYEMAIQTNFVTQIKRLYQCSLSYSSETIIFVLQLKILATYLSVILQALNIPLPPKFAITQNILDAAYAIYAYRWQLI